MKRFPSLETKTFVAYIADNSSLGIHRSGYNGIASLIPKHSGNNLFVPMYAGLNYETISLTGLSPYTHPGGSKFEPRSEPMHIECATAGEVVLIQPETSHSHVGARITFSVEEPYYLHQHIELAFHKRFCTMEESNAFRSLWASYIHMPSDRHIYLKPDLEEGAELEGWVGITKADHGYLSDHSVDTEVRRLPDTDEITPAEHLEEMRRQKPQKTADLFDSAKPDSSTQPISHRILGPLAFYYGFCHGEQQFLMMFAQPGRFRLAYSPCGAGKEPAWNPAWDYILHLDDAKTGVVYSWDVCLAVKPYKGRKDVLGEVRSYLNRFRT